MNRSGSEAALFGSFRGALADRFVFRFQAPKDHAQEAEIVDVARRQRSTCFSFVSFEYMSAEKAHLLKTKGAKKNKS